MSSFIFIELDTKSPEIEIYAPSYTTSSMSNRIIVESDENLSDFQNIYVIDSANNKTNYTFSKSDNKTLTGIISFTNASLGIATIYVEVEDDVGNKSEIFNKRINIKDSISLLSLEIEDSVVKIIDECVTWNISTSEITRTITPNEITRTITMERGIIHEQ